MPSNLAVPEEQRKDLGAVYTDRIILHLDDLDRCKPDRVVRSPPRRRTPADPYAPATAWISATCVSSTSEPFSAGVNNVVRDLHASTVDSDGPQRELDTLGLLAGGRP